MLQLSDIFSNKNCTSEPYTKFCNEVIEQRIIKGGEIVRISRLADIYSEYYREAIDDASVCTISSGNLKCKLKKSHPDLIYFSLKEVANCELVCSGCSTNAMSVDTVTSSDESTCADSSYDPVPLVDVTNNEKRDLFLSSQVLKNAIDDAPKLSVPNPPLAQDLQLDSAEKIIPNQLFNFLAWVTALSSCLLIHLMVTVSKVYLFRTKTHDESCCLYART